MAIAKPGPYTTKLNPQQEAAFQQWVKANNIPWQDTPKADYDMRGFYKALQSGDKRATTAINPSDNQVHFPDTWKTPYHKTFSNQSIYATKDAPHWQGNKLIDKNGKVLADETPKAVPKGSGVKKGQTVNQIDIDSGNAAPGTGGTKFGSVAYTQAAAAFKRTGGRGVASAVAAQTQAKPAPPIGVDSNYVPPSKAIAGYYGKTAPPQYTAGMENGAGVNGFPQTTAGVAQLQQSLVAAQLLKAGTYAPGQWDTASAKAYAEILADANLAGDDWQTSLGNRLTAAAKGQLLSQKASQRNPLVIKLTSPEDIQAAAQNATKTLHNTYMTPQELDQFTKAYQQQEAQFQTASYQSTGFDPLTGQADTSSFSSDTDANGNPIPGSVNPNAQGATLTAPPTGAGLEQAITNKTIAEHPNEFAANTFTDRLNEILSSFQAPFSNPSQVGPL